MQQYELILSKWLDSINFTVQDMVIPSANVKQVMIQDGTVYFLKVKGAVEEVNRELYLGSLLKKYNVPIAEPMINKAKSYYSLHEGKLYCLYEALAGKTAAAANTSEQAYLFGEAISRLHAGLSHADNSKAYVKNMDFNKLLREWAIPESLKLDNRVLIINDFMRIHFFPIIEQLPEQMIHRDAHPYNFLFDGSRLSGFLDFDIASIGPRIFDPLYCSTAILMNQFDHWKSNMAWFELLKEIIKGYEQNIPLTAVERKALFPMLLSIQLIFAAYFMKYNVEISKANLEAAFWLLAHQDTIMNIVK